MRKESEKNSEGARSKEISEESEVSVVQRPFQQGTQDDRRTPRRESRVEAGGAEALAGPLFNHPQTQVALDDVNGGRDDAESAASVDTKKGEAGGDGEGEEDGDANWMGRISSGLFGAVQNMWKSEAPKVTAAAGKAAGNVTGEVGKFLSALGATVSSSVEAVTDFLAGGEAADEVALMRDGRVVLNVVRAKGELPTLLSAAGELHWRVHMKSGSDRLGHFVWFGSSAATPDEFRALTSRLQVVNKIPGMHELARKRWTCLLLRRCQRLFPDEFAFVPPTYMLPEDRPVLTRLLSSRRKQIYILKPDAGLKGKGLQLVTRRSDIDRSIWMGSGHCVVQRYIGRPLLLPCGRKFDFRVFALVTDVRGDVPQVFVSREGLVRFCTERYETPGRGNLDCVFAHFCNSSLNKNNRMEYKCFEDAHDSRNSKRPLRDVLEEIDRHTRFSADSVWAQVVSIVQKTMLALGPLACHRLHCTLEESNRGGLGDFSRCFHIMGFDILLDENGKAWLLEINSSPSLSSQLPLPSTPRAEAESQQESKKHPEVDSTIRRREDSTEHDAGRESSQQDLSRPAQNDPSQTQEVLPPNSQHPTQPHSKRDGNQPQACAREEKSSLVLGSPEAASGTGGLPDLPPQPARDSALEETVPQTSSGIEEAPGENGAGNAVNCRSEREYRPGTTRRGGVGVGAEGEEGAARPGHCAAGERRRGRRGKEGDGTSRSPTPSRRDVDGKRRRKRNGTSKAPPPISSVDILVKTAVVRDALRLVFLSSLAPAALRDHQALCNPSDGGKGTGEEGGGGRVEMQTHTGAGLAVSRRSTSARAVSQRESHQGAPAEGGGGPRWAQESSRSVSEDPGPSPVSEPEACRRMIMEHRRREKAKERGRAEGVTAAQQQFRERGNGSDGSPDGLPGPLGEINRGPRKLRLALQCPLPDPSAVPPGDPKKGIKGDGGVDLPAPCNSQRGTGTGREALVDGEFSEGQKKAPTPKQADPASIWNFFSTSGTTRTPPNGSKIDEEEDPGGEGKMEGRRYSGGRIGGARRRKREMRRRRHLEALRLGSEAACLPFPIRWGCWVSVLPESAAAQQQAELHRQSQAVSCNAEGGAEKQNRGEDCGSWERSPVGSPSSNSVALACVSQTDCPSFRPHPPTVENEKSKEGLLSLSRAFASSWKDPPAAFADHTAISPGSLGTESTCASSFSSNTPFALMNPKDSLRGGETRVNVSLSGGSLRGVNCHPRRGLNTLEQRLALFGASRVIFESLVKPPNRLMLKADFLFLLRKSRLVSSRRAAGDVSMLRENVAPPTASAVSCVDSPRKEGAVWDSQQQHTDALLPSPASPVKALGEAEICPVTAASTAKPPPLTETDRLPSSATATTTAAPMEASPLHGGSGSPSSAVSAFVSQSLSSSALLSTARHGSLSSSVRPINVKPPVAPSLSLETAERMWEETVTSLQAAGRRVPRRKQHERERERDRRLGLLDRTATEPGQESFGHEDPPWWWADLVGGGEGSGGEPGLTLWGFWDLLERLCDVLYPVAGKPGWRSSQALFHPHTPPASHGGMLRGAPFGSSSAASSCTYSSLLPPAQNGSRLRDLLATEASASVAGGGCPSSIVSMPVFSSVAGGARARLAQGVRSGKGGGALLRSGNEGDTSPSRGASPPGVDGSTSSDTLPKCLERRRRQLSRFLEPLSEEESVETPPQERTEKEEEKEEGEAAAVPSTADGSPQGVRGEVCTEEEGSKEALKEKAVSRTSSSSSSSCGRGEVHGKSRIGDGGPGGDSSFKSLSRRSSSTRLRPLAPSPLCPPGALDLSALSEAFENAVSSETAAGQRENDVDLCLTSGNWPTESAVPVDADESRNFFRLSRGGRRSADSSASASVISAASSTVSHRSVRLYSGSRKNEESFVKGRGASEEGGQRSWHSLSGGTPDGVSVSLEGPARRSSLREDGRGTAESLSSVRRRSDSSSILVPFQPGWADGEGRQETTRLSEYGYAVGGPGHGPPQGGVENEERLLSLALCEEARVRRRKLRQLLLKLGKRLGESDGKAVRALLVVGEQD
uniref:Tubulin-tyrosine ligase family protein n=1 Tax=Chromera velia CCMP2878 TaxID=1169474 RepID=A0A0G4G495_9ALVE|eukprot:Cvel_20137.t1-p1 / transcript=Cvel_20137.t1 / gene=Cvel_20137 / organism=Chromera_velia_CCMP2878 / gene_product=Tubulin polyglutamylase TTLL6, putative / transcript_product=Tubulin polyglutamylase TTLL6, putative / location=Cvel_scaffold1786:26111-35915(-) / protein_length=2042 / sequence_SO=supercontig / SO=protein_coding / is_pseudo=false